MMDETKDGASVIDMHLSEEQLDEVLMEIAEPAALLHAKSCTLCTQRLNEFRVAMGTFNEATLSWSEARASNMPPIPERTGARGWLQGGLNASPRLTYAGAAVAAVVMFIAGAVHDRTTGRPGQGQVGAPGSDYFSSRQQEISSDNAMLSAISAELYQPVSISETLDAGQVHSSKSMLKQASN